MGSGKFDYPGNIVMSARILENLHDLLSDLPELLAELFTDNQEVMVVGAVMLLAYLIFLKKH
jgi:hypothetical protein